MCLAYVFDDKTVSMVYGVHDFLLLYVVPILLIIYMYVRIQVHQSWPHPWPTPTRISKAQRNLLKTLMLVSVAYALCWSSGSITWFLWNCGFLQEMDSALLRVSYVLVNACINPFIYMYIVQFREFKRCEGNMVAIACHTLPSTT